MTFTTFSLSTLSQLNTRAAAQPVLTTTTTTSMSSFAAIPILGYSVLALVFSYIVQRLIRIVNFRNLLSRSSSATSSSSSNSSLETLPTSNAVPSEPKKSRIPVPSWDLTPFKKTTANAYRKASALLPSRGNSVELLPTHVASPPPTAALVDYGVYAEQQSTFQTPATPLPFPPTPPLTSSPSPGTSTTSPGPRTPSPAHHSHSPFSSIPLRIPLPTPFSLFPGPYVPLQPQPKGIISPNRPRTPSPPFLATTPPPTTAHRRSKSLGGVPVRKVANSRLGLTFPHAEAEVEMRDLYRTSKDAPLIDFSSSSEGEQEDQDDEDVGVFGRRNSRRAKGGQDDLVPGGPLELVSMPLVDLSDTTHAQESEGEDVFGFKTGVMMSRRRSIGGDVEVELVALKRDVDLLPLPLPPKNLAHALIDIDIDPSITEEKLVDLDVDTSSSRTISPMEPVVLSVGTSRVVSREASPVPMNVEPLVHLPVAVRPVAQLPIVAPVSNLDLDEAVVPVESQEEGGDELVHVDYDDVVPVKGNEAEAEAAEEEVAEVEEEEEEEAEVEEEEEGVLVDVSPRPVDVDVSLPEAVDVAEEVDVDVEAEVDVGSQPGVVEVSAAPVVEGSQPVDVDVSRPVDVEVSFPEVLEAPFPQTTDVLLVDVHASPEPSKRADLPQDQDQATSEQKPTATAWQWDEEDDMMRAWSLGLDLVDAPLSLPLPLDADVHPLRNDDVSLLDEKPPYDLLIQQEPEPESPPTSVENSPPLPLLPPLTIPLITISNDIKRSPEEEYPDPELLPLPDFDFSSTMAKEDKEKRSPPSQTPTPPDSPPPSSPGSLGVVMTRTAPSSPRISPAGLRPAWSLRAADAPPLGLSSSSSSSSTPVASPSLKKGGVVLQQEEVVEEEETEKVGLSEALPGSFPDSQSSSNTTTTTTTTPSIKTISALINTPDTQRIRVSRSPLDIALAMQLRPGLGLGADPAWMVRFLMAMFGWFAILVSGQGEF